MTKFIKIPVLERNEEAKKISKYPILTLNVDRIRSYQKVRPEDIKYAKSCGWEENTELTIILTDSLAVRSITPSCVFCLLSVEILDDLLGVS